jgi:COP9 signalosome complex subunit 8
VNKIVLIFFSIRSNAKFLWKRIPSSVKSNYPELAKVWEVGKALWRRDPPSVFLALQAHPWSDNIEDIMNGIKGVYLMY